MIHVLHVLGNTNLGGAESRVMDLYRHIDREKIQFDFLVHSNDKGFYEDEIEKLGGHIYRVPRFRVVNLSEYKKAMFDFFGSHKEYRVVQGHMTSTASIYLPIAKKLGVPVTIAHVRSAGVDPGAKGIMTKWLRRNLAKKADFLFACSMLAGESAFGKRAVKDGKVTYVPNAITTERFIYNSECRERLREKLGLTDRFVIGHVGRFHYAKNHEYLIEIFRETVKREPNAVLLLVGEGPLMDSIKTMAEKYLLMDKVIFAGNRKNVEDYYQAMDYFVFPSRFEGLPGTVIEALASGLHCLISDTIADEVKISSNCRQMSIQTEPAEWADVVCTDRDYKRNDMTECIRSHGFDSTLQAQRMMHFYETGEITE